MQLGVRSPVGEQFLLAVGLPPPQLNNLCNSWDCAIEAIDGGRMDKVDLIDGGPYARGRGTCRIRCMITPRFCDW